MRHAVLRYNRFSRLSSNNNNNNNNNKKEKKEKEGKIERRAEEPPWGVPVWCVPPALNYGRPWRARGVELFLPADGLAVVKIVEF